MKKLFNFFFKKSTPVSPITDDVKSWVKYCSLREQCACKESWQVIGVGYMCEGVVDSKK